MKKIFLLLILSLGLTALSYAYSYNQAPTASTTTVVSSAGLIDGVIWCNPTSSTFTLVLCDGTTIANNVKVKVFVSSNSFNFINIKDIGYTNFDTGLAVFSDNAITGANVTYIYDRR